MPLKIICTKCNTEYNVEEINIGKKFKCKNCDNIIEVKASIKKEIENNDSINDETINKETINGERANEEITNKKGSFIKIIVVFLLVLFIFAGGYAYYSKVIKNSSPNDISSNSALLELKNNEINYGFNINGNFKAIYKGQVAGTGSLKISDLEILSKENGLKQKISLGNLLASININNNKSNFEIKNLDILSDNQKVYLFIEKGFEKISELGIKSPLITKLQTIFEQNKYAFIDNGKPIFEIFGELGNNKLIKQILLGAVTSNPNEYYLKNGVYDDLNKILVKDDFVNYLFKDGIKDEATGKIPLSLNKNICNDYGPVILNLGKQLQNIDPLNTNNLTKEEIINECNNYISQVNEFLPMILQVYKKGDIENGNFDLAIINGNMAEINVNYKGHIINTWNFSLKIPDESLLIKVNGNKDKIMSSTLKVNFEQSGIKINGEIIDGTGKIDINGKIDNPYSKLDILGNIVLSNYKLTNYDIDYIANYGEGDDGKITAKGNGNSGKINFDINDDGDFIKTDFDYDLLQKSYNLDYKTNYYNLNSSYLNKKFIFNGYSVNRNGNKSNEIDISIDNGKIVGKIFEKNQIDLSIDGEYNNTKDFKIEFIEKINNIGINLESKIKGLSEIDYVLLIKKQEKVLFDSILNIKESTDNETKIYDANLNIKFDSGIYDEQINKARDTTRIMDLKILQSAVEQVYQDNGEYPSKEEFDKLVKMYLPRIPKDLLGNTELNGCKFGYVYSVGDDNNGIKNQTYKLSTCLENASNIERKANNDGGTIKNKFEVGILKNSNYKEEFYINNYKTWKKSNTEFEENSFKANFKVGIKKGGVKFKLPVNYQEADININEIFVLPDFGSIGRSKINNKTLLIGGATGLAVGGTVAFISLQGYSKEARNSKRIADLSNLNSIINIKLTTGTPIESFVVRDEKYEGKNLYIGGQKLVPGVNYFVGTPNYSDLNIKKSEFMDPNGTEYIIGVTTINGGAFQILTLLEDGSYSKVSKIRGYYKAQEKLILKEGKDFESVNKNIIKLLNNKDIFKIRKGNIISGNEVIKVSFDGKNITFRDIFNKKVIITRSDSKGLIFIDGKVIMDNTNLY